jgi:hypothetical protein
MNKYEAMADKIIESKKCFTFEERYQLPMEVQIYAWGCVYIRIPNG